MGDFSFPFPGRELAAKELSYDSCYAKIPAEDRESIIEKAWTKGEQAAQMVYKRYHGEADFLVIVQKSGLVCEKVNTDYIAGNQRYFSDYLTGQNLIHLYMKSIDLWAEQNNIDIDNAVNLILSHEYYHYLEWNKIGLTSREYQVPILQIGPVKIGKTGIRALSEIGAHAFARRYYEKCQG